MCTWDLDPVLFDGATPLRYYGLIFALTVVGGFFLWRWQMHRGGHDEQTSAIFLVYGLVAVVLGARLGHCLFYDYEHCFSPWYTVLMVWKGGLASHGATLGLVLALLIYSWRHGLPFSEAIDRFSFAAALGAGTVRLGNFFNSEIVGRPTDGSWGVRFPLYDRVPLEQVPLRHPSQLYELGLGLVVLGVLLLVDRRLGEERPRGLLAALFFVSYFIGRFVVEYFKEYQALAPGGLTMGQWLSVAPVLFGAGWMVVIWRRDAAAG
jgi:phosphatidylglycerol:prolipoprotein diacylglycerol transferase